MNQLFVQPNANRRLTSHMEVDAPFFGGGDETQTIIRSRCHLSRLARKYTEEVDEAVALRRKRVPLKPLGLPSGLSLVLGNLHFRRLVLLRAAPGVHVHWVRPGHPPTRFGKYVQLVRAQLRGFGKVLFGFLVPASLGEVSAAGDPSRASLGASAIAWAKSASARSCCPNSAKMRPRAIQTCGSPGRASMAAAKSFSAISDLPMWARTRPWMSRIQGESGAAIPRIAKCASRWTITNSVSVQT